MTIPLSDVINVNITQQTRTVVQAGFGVPLILGAHTRFPEGEVREYANLTAVQADFQSGDAVLDKATALFSQDLKPTKIRVGRRKSAVAQVVNVTVANIVNDQEYSVKINGVEFTFTSDADATAAEIITGLHTAINAGSEPVTSTDNTGDLDLTADTAGESFTLELDTNLSSTTTTANVGMFSDINDVEQVQKDWYFLIITETDDLSLLEAAKSIEARNKFFMAVTRDAGVKAATTTDIVALLSAKNYKRTAIWYIEDAASHPEAAVVGRLGPEEAGSVNWKFKNLSGVVATNLTATEKTNVLSKNSNIFEEFGGVDVTSDGRVVGSPTIFIDLMRGTDFIQARIQESIATLLINEAKVPFTNKGRDALLSKIRAVLNIAVEQQIIVDTPDQPIVITAPDVTAVSTTDKANRNFPDVEFSAFFSGAINSVKIDGKISV